MVRGHAATSVAWGRTGWLSGIAESAGKCKADCGKWPAGAFPGQFRPATAEPKQLVSLGRSAQFTRALPGKLFPHVRVHRPHLAPDTAGEVSRIGRKGLTFAVPVLGPRLPLRVRFTVISSISHAHAQL